MRFVIDYKKLTFACVNECMDYVELFRKAQISVCVLNNIKHGKPVHAKTLGKLSKTLHMKPIDLLKEDDYEQS